MVMAEKLCLAVSGLKIKHEFSKASEVVTISMGVATMIPLSSTSEEVLIASADQALYEAKEEGRNRACQAAAHS